MSTELLAAIFERGASANHSAALVVLAAMAYLADADGNLRASSKEVAERAQCSAVSVRRVWPALIASGDLVVVEPAIGSRPGLYQIARAIARADRYSKPVAVSDCARTLIQPSGVSSSRAPARTLPLTLEIQQLQDQQPHVDELTLDDRSTLNIILDAWCEATGKRRASVVLSDKRRRLIASALKSYPLPDVVDAVRGWRHSPHHCGDNERSTIYNSIELLLRDAEHIEKFRDLERDGPAVRPLRLSGGAQNLRRLQQMEAGR